LKTIRALDSDMTAQASRSMRCQLEAMSMRADDLEPSDASNRKSEERVLFALLSHQLKSLTILLCVVFHHTVTRALIQYAILVVRFLLKRCPGPPGRAITNFHWLLSEVTSRTSTPNGRKYWRIICLTTVLVKPSPPRMHSTRSPNRMSLASLY
jgi:hypothetical protein